MPDEKMTYEKAQDSMQAFLESLTPDELARNRVDDEPLLVNQMTLTIRQASEACRVHRRTIMRRLEAGTLPNARRGAAGEWRIPVTDLIAAGLKPSPHGSADKQLRPDEAGQVQRRNDMKADAIDSIALNEMAAEVADWRRRAEVAEAIAAERGHALEDARLALRALTAGENHAGPVESGLRTPPRHWWNRENK